MKTFFHALLPWVSFGLAGLNGLAQDRYWDGTDTTANADGGAGTWNTSATNWDDAATAGADQSFSSGQNAFFSTPGGTVTVGGAFSAGVVTLGGTGYSFDFGANPMTWATLAGTGGFAMTGTSTLTLSNASTASGTVVINGGRLTMGNNAALGTCAVTLNGGTLERNAAGVTVANNIEVGAGGGTLLGRQVVDNYTLFSGLLTGSGAMTVQGLVTLNNPGNTYSGPITISTTSATYLRLSASEVLGDAATVTLTGANSLLRLDGGVTETIAALSGTGSVFVSNVGSGLAGTLKFGGNNLNTAYSGALNNSDGQLFLVKQGTGTFTLSPSNSAYQGLTVSSGTVLATNVNGGAGPTVILGDADTGTSAVAFLTTSSGASRNITVNASGSGTATIGSTTGAGAGNVVFSGTTTLHRATTITAASTDRTTWNGKITGSVGTLTIAGGQRTVFDNTTSDFSGNIVITGTNTVLQTGVGTGSEHLPNGSSVNVGAGAFLKLAGLANTTETVNALTGSGTVRRHEGVGGLVTLIIGSADGGGVFSGPLQNGAGTLALTKNGTGTQTLSGSSSYTGTTTVNGGTIKIGNMNGLGGFIAGRPVTQVVVNAGGAVDFNGVADAVYGYTIAGTGIGGTGALVNTGGGIGNGSAQTSNIKLSANATVGGTGNWALLTNIHNATSLDLNGFTLTKAGANAIGLVSATTTAGTVNVAVGTLGFGVTNGGTGVAGAASAFDLANSAGVSLSRPFHKSANIFLCSVP